jgi:hypothetical protein
LRPELAEQKNREEEGVIPSSFPEKARNFFSRATESGGQRA